MYKHIIISYCRQPNYNFKCELNIIKILFNLVKS